MLAPHCCSACLLGAPKLAEEVPGPALCCSGSCRAFLCRRTPPAWLGLGPSAALLLERSRESCPLPYPFPRPCCPGHSLPSSPTGAGGHPLALTLSLEASYILSLVASALPGLSASLLLPSPTLQYLGKSHKPSLPCPAGDTGVGGQGTVLSRGSEHWEGAHTPADAPGGSPGPAQGSNLGMAGGTKVASLLAHSPSHPLLWILASSWAGCPGFLSLGLVGARWMHSTLPAQWAGGSCLSSKAVFSKAGCTQQSVGVQGKILDLQLYMHIIYTSINIHLLGGASSKILTDGCATKTLGDAAGKKGGGSWEQKVATWGGTSHAMWACEPVPQFGVAEPCPSDTALLWASSVRSRWAASRPRTPRTWARGCMHLAGTWLPLRGRGRRRQCRVAGPLPSTASVGWRGTGFVLTRNFPRRRFSRTGGEGTAVRAGRAHAPAHVLMSSGLMSGTGAEGAWGHLGGCPRGFVPTGGFSSHLVSHADAWEHLRARSPPSTPSAGQDNAVPTRLGVPHPCPWSQGRERDSSFSPKPWPPSHGPHQPPPWWESTAGRGSPRAAWPWRQSDAAAR